jgi:hypothetical protein
MGEKSLAFLHDSFRDYFCAEALLAPGRMLEAELVADRYEDVVYFLHDLLDGVAMQTVDDLLQQLQVRWAYALQLHERHDPAALQVIEQTQQLFDTHVHLLRHQPTEAQRWQRELRRQQARSLYKFQGGFRAALETYALNYQERQAAGDELGQIRELNAAAKVFHDTYDFPAALALLGRCITYWEQALQDPELSPADVKVFKDGPARSLGALGETLLKLQDVDGAISCFEQNRALMAEVGGDVARADVRLADCATELALHASGGEQARYLDRAAHYLQRAEDCYQGQEYVLGFVHKQWLKLRLAQARWSEAITLAERYLTQGAGGYIKGYLLFYRGQALVALEDHRAASEAFAASTAAFLHEHYTLEAAGVHLAWAAATTAAGGDGAPQIRQALDLIQTFQRQYATLRAQYFGAELRQWLPDNLAWLEARFPGLQQRLTGPYASAQALFAWISTEIESTREAEPTERTVHWLRQINRYLV